MDGARDSRCPLEASAVALHLTAAAHGVGISVVSSKTATSLPPSLRSPCERQAAVFDYPHGLGTLIVLIIRLPLIRNSTENGWKPRQSSSTWPPKKWSPTRPAAKSAAMIITSRMLVGIGVPSK